MAAIAQTNTYITFTNKSGVVISNAEVVKVDANKVTYRIPSGGGTVKLADLPPEVQEQFNYDAAKADMADEKENLKQAADLQQRAAMSAAIAKYNQLRDQLIQGSRRVDGKVLQRISEGLLVDSGAASITRAEERHYGTSPDGNPISWGGGTIMEGNSPGAEALHLVLLQDYPDPNVVDDGHVDIFAYPVGLYSYETVGKSQKTVRKFSCNLDAAIRTLALQEQN